MKELLSAPTLEAGIARLAGQLNDRFGQQPIVVVGVLTGCVVIVADLIRRLRMPLRIGFLQASSYRESTQRGHLELQTQWLPPLAGQHVVVIDDILDTGHTLAKVLEQLRAAEPASLCSVVLLRKQGRQEVDVRADFEAFEIPDVFVVGYGLDYNGLYRNLPYLAAVEEHDLADSHP